MQSVLIIGQSGQVSTYLQERLSGDYRVDVAGRDRVDLADRRSIKDALKSFSPTLIVNPAAFTAVDSAEDESEMAFAVNAEAVAEIAEYCAENNTPLIHFSTDYVFDGEADSAYTEEDVPAPTGVYGASKLAGEQAIIDSDAPAIILRTSWVYSNVGKNFYKTMLSLSESRAELSVVGDQIGSPTFAGSIADACGALITKVLDQGEIASEQKGVYNLSCEGETSWAGFAQAIFTAHGKSKMVVKSITTAEYPTPTKRPAYSVLSGAKLANVFGVELPDWHKGLEDCVNETR
jgi:dTDP-4-dehydrorhamnose reductase